MYLIICFSFHLLRGHRFIHQQAAQKHHVVPTRKESTTHKTASVKHMKKRRRGERPELIWSASEASTSFYDAKESERYIRAANISGIQDELCIRALHMLQSSINKRGPLLLLDIGIGAGACANVIQRQSPHYIVGLDKSVDMLTEGLQLKFPRDILAYDFCQSLPFRSNFKFDGMISISALQWLCCAQDDDEPIRKFMKAVNSLLVPGGIFVAQFFPIRPSDCCRLLKATQKESTLEARIVMDMPHKNKSKRYFLACRQTSQTGRIFLHPAPFCPCSWPNEGTCALHIHKTENNSWCDNISESSEHSRACWMNRLERAHILYAKRAQQVLERLWAVEQKKLGGEPTRHRRIMVVEPEGRNIERKFSNLGLCWDEFYRRRARLEAFMCGNKKKADEKHLLPCFQDQPVSKLIEDAENEVKYLSCLPCFQHCDLYLLRTKKRKKR